jgi:hypothetical protein
MSHLEVALLSELRQVLQEEFRDIVTQVITQEVLEKTKTIAAIPSEYGEYGEQAGQALPGDPGASAGTNASNNPGSIGQEMHAHAHRNTTTRAALSQGKGMGESVEYKGVLPSKIGS